MTNAIEHIELTRAYVALSNAHRLEFIRAMFDERAVYHSAHVGEFAGRDAIAEMMNGFFSRFPDVHWDAVNYRSVESGCVTFEFSMTATEKATGKSIERTGVETVAFNENGLIRRLEVR